MNVPAYSNTGTYGSIQTPSESLSSNLPNGYTAVSSALVAYGYTNTGSSIPNTAQPISINFFDPGRTNWVVPNFVSSQS